MASSAPNSGEGPLGLRVPIGAQSPDDEDRLLEAHRRLDANADLHLVLAGIPPPVPRAWHDGELLSRRKRALPTVQHERDPPRPDLYVLGESAAYCVVSEALMNAAKHARATSASVRLTRENGGLMVAVATTEWAAPIP